MNDDDSMVTHYGKRPSWSSNRRIQGMIFFRYFVRSFYSVFFFGSFGLLYYCLLFTAVIVNLSSLLFSFRPIRSMQLNRRLQLSNNTTHPTPSHTSSLLLLQATHGGKMPPDPLPIMLAKLMVPCLFYQVST